MEELEPVTYSMWVWLEAANVGAPQLRIVKLIAARQRAVRICGAGRYGLLTTCRTMGDLKELVFSSLDKHDCGVGLLWSRVLV